MLDNRQAQYKENTPREQSQRDKQNSPIPKIKDKLEKMKNLTDLSAEDLVSYADKIGKFLKDNGLKTTQIRKFLDGVRKLDIQFSRGRNFNKDSVILLKIKLVWSAVKQEKTVKPLMEVLAPAIDTGAQSYESFKKLLAFIEGIVAYHKYHGGGD